MVARLAEYISLCPYLEGSKLRVNYLDKEIGSASLEMATEQKTLRNYADGGRLERMVFVLALREGFGMGDFENQRAVMKCKEIEKWIEKEPWEESAAEIVEDSLLVWAKLLKPFRLVRTEGSFARYEAEIEVVCLKK